MFETDSRDPLDDVIDRAARSMTAVTPRAAPRAALRSRVNPRRGPVFSQAWRVSAGFAAVILIVGASSDWFTARRDAGIVERSRPVAPAVSRPAAAFSAEDAAAAKTSVPSRALALDSASGRGDSAVSDRLSNGRSDSMQLSPAAASAQATGSGLPAVVLRPLPDDVVVVEAISIEPVAEETVEIELIEMPMPLRAEWVEIEPQSFE